MTQHEYFPTSVSAKIYSRFHRRDNMVAHGVDFDLANKASTIDIDTIVWIETDPNDYSPLMLVETAIDSPRPKNTSGIMALAKRARMVAILVLFTPSQPVTEDSDVLSLRVRRIWPNPNSFVTLTPAEYLNRIAGYVREFDSADEFFEKTLAAQSIPPVVPKPLQLSDGTAPGPETPASAHPGAAAGYRARGFLSDSAGPVEPAHAAPEQPPDHRHHRCAICGVGCSFGVGPPGVPASVDPAAYRWYCAEHLPPP